MDNHQTPEFLFGTLSTREGRVKRARTLNLGFHHDAVLHPIDPRPNEPITITARAGIGVAVKTSMLCYTTDGTLPEANTAAMSASLICTPMQCTSIDWDTLAWAYVQTWSATIPGMAEGTLVRYIIVATTDSGELIACPYFDLEVPEIRAQPDAYDHSYLARQMRYGTLQVYEFYVDTLSTPAWLRNAIVYQIFAERFAPNPGETFVELSERAGFFGGTLKGIIPKLDYLSALGITCLWLTPIFPSPSHHGYDPTDPFTIEPRLGTDADFRELVVAAHQRGIRLVLDFVVNHLSNAHPAFIAAQRNPTSPYRDWFFFRDYPDAYESFYDVPGQPLVNTNHPEVRQYFIDAACSWLKAGCDGFRLDHAHGASHAFWSAFRTAIRAVKPDSATFGEVTDTPAVIRSFAGRMDGCLDFYLLELVRGFFAFHSLTVSQFDRALQEHFAYFDSLLVLPSFLDNHDMNRFLWIVDGDTRRLRLAALCQFTLPGPPIVYYGTEVGLSQLQAVGRLEEARLPMRWDEQQDATLLAFYQRLIALRRQTSGVWSMPRETVLVDDTRGIYVYRCGAYFVALNNTDEANHITLATGQKATLLVATEKAVTLRLDNQLDLPPFAGAVYQIISSENRHSGGW